MVPTGRITSTKWTSPQATAQTYSIYVTYQLPSTFKVPTGTNIARRGRTDNGSNGGSATVQYQIYRNNWHRPYLLRVDHQRIDRQYRLRGKSVMQPVLPTPSTCGFAPSNSIVFKIDVMTTSKNANAYVGNLNLPLVTSSSPILVMVQ